MAKLIEGVEGVGEVIRNLRKFRTQTAKATQKALKRTGLLVQRLSQNVVPIKTSTLKNSAFTRSFGKGFLTDIVVGYTAEYAVYVHENLKSRHKPGRIAKYLEKPIKDNRTNILRLIAGEIKVVFKKMPRVEEEKGIPSEIIFREVK